ncbi:GTP-binding protein YchF [Rickettsia prowazekii str. GvV257]|uniref:Ribosome-binding ATPase YchF n=1 Tax=Rickettsia prowazekii (strain Madrid E) TaxID=272947 RepID=Q9ZCV5_RICPR|nr:redox-regulated ATPase YchF [Rickettsia prowazekii]EOB09981.1 transporter [Rickettsia prowazekii str. GvF12]AFE50248.1 GTP-binding protein YchF [Rickettsia prowazekii str. Katsinyian]AFE51094.1 GTP-binding protein YchF [Rickettsia prowazekii str. BuV67-CWPP]AFE53026.1 GTP-binding protein YchF [Rickettsia prowazekii str. GvV257]AFE53598.1 GTP-binding protein YchF [Rickettsia prowazekii str. RpGvF24]
MTLKLGIVGLPNVGKSTLFNALTASQIADAANYPFCTIEPNSSKVLVPDERLQRLVSLVGSNKMIPSYIEFVDIAGLVKGASKGDGLGNKFLSHIREVDAILHVLRCFEDEDIMHVHNKIDPLYDIEVIETELILTDIASLEKHFIKSEKRLKSGDKKMVEQIALLKEIYKVLAEGKPARILNEVLGADNLKQLQLITSKPILYVCNVFEQDAAIGNKFTQLVAKRAETEKTKSLVISSKIESEIALLESVEEKEEFLKYIGLNKTGLSKVIKEGYNLLNLKSFFTIGPKEAHSWTFKDGTLAPAAAGIIHTDFEKGFIRAEVISYEDYINLGSEAKAKEVGKMRLEGKDYKMQDGDIVHFRFNI